VKKEDVIIKLIEESKESTDKRLDSIDINLSEHMRRTDVLEQLHQDNQSRITTLEEPRKALILLKTVVLYIAAVVGAISAVLKLWGK